jgi:hypothetical protein
VIAVLHNLVSNARPFQIHFKYSLCRIRHFYGSLARIIHELSANGRLHRDLLINQAFDYCMKRRSGRCERKYLTGRAYYLPIAGNSRFRDVSMPLAAFAQPFQSSFSATGHLCAKPFVQQFPDILVREGRR